MSLFTPPAYPDPVTVIFYDDFVAASYNNRIWAVTGTGSITSLSSVGGRIRVRANAANSYRINHGNFGAYSVANRATVTWRGSMTPATAANGLCECGFQSATNPTTGLIHWQYAPNRPSSDTFCF